MRRRVSLSWLWSFALAGCSVFGIRSGYEQPPYERLATLADDVEVRRYGPRLAAETVVTGTDEERARSEAFRILAAYIFGANAGEREIAMTAPVQIEDGNTEIAMTAPVVVAAPQPGQWTMRFFLPARYDASTAPAPSDRRVRLVEAPAMTLAVLRFSGSASPAAVAARTTDLRRAVESSQWRAVGEPMALFYDPPWTIPWWRRNEVAIPVEPR